MDLRNNVTIIPNNKEDRIMVFGSL